MKHAYLIIAHNSPQLLKELLQAIDDVRNDIYIHIDIKANININELYTEKSLLKILPNRLDARWGDFSLVQIEIMLFEEAVRNGNYSYYHLLSGVDFPIKSQNYIHEYCKKYNGTEFIGFAQNVSDKELIWRSQHYFLFSRDFQTNCLVKKLIRAVYARIQSLVGYKRTSIVIKKGCQWCSITHNFVVYILKNKDIIQKHFNHTYCPDELFIQTLCWNSEFKDHIYNIEDEFNSCKRYILWEDSKLLTLDNKDASVLIASDKWFARKFTEKGINTIHDIKEHIEDNICD